MRNDLFPYFAGGVLLAALICALVRPVCALLVYVSERLIPVFGG